MKNVMLFLVALGLSAPAAATTGMVCRTAGARPLEVSMTVGHGVVPVIVSARLGDNGRSVPSRIARSWLDSSELRLDLVDDAAMRSEARLRARKNGRVYDGTIVRSGRSRWVRCREG